MTSQVLLTGFEPFGGRDINPSQIIANKLNAEKINHTVIIGRTIKLEFNKIREQICSLVDEIDPDYILLSGQANGNSISLEKIALNYVDSRGHPYNCGTIVKGQMIDENAPAAYFSNLNLQEFKERLQNEGIPARISYFAGTFGCNQLYFETAHYLHFLGKISRIPFVFVHLPLLPSQALSGEKPTMSLDLIIRGIRVIISEMTRSPQTF